MSPLKEEEGEEGHGTVSPLSPDPGNIRFLSQCRIILLLLSMADHSAIQFNELH